MAYTGSRLGEIRSIVWEKVVFASEHIYLAETKNGDERRIPMRKGSTLYKMLKDMKQSRKKAGYVFLNQWDYQISANQIRDMIIKFQKTYPDQKRWRCHDLRHKSIKMTVDLYGQVKACDVEIVNPYD